MIHSEPKTSIYQPILGQLNTYDKSIGDIRFVMVDEYQDTNLLQEQIYFELAKHAIKNFGGITVVGDDDQSLYRFRGATVDLFQAFPERISIQLGVIPQLITLNKNYRSTDSIVNFCNDFINLDSKFKEARVKNKPSIKPGRMEVSNEPLVEYPILGLFRDDVETLSRDLAKFIRDVISGGGVNVRDHNKKLLTIKIDPDGGSSADIAMLCSSPRDLDYLGRPRLPLLLRQELMRFNPVISIFNPRGRNLERIQSVTILCGLLLECIDPGSLVQKGTTKLPKGARDVFDLWRRKAKKFIAESAISGDSRGLEQFVYAWQKREPLGPKRNWVNDHSLIDLIYKLVSWIPEMQTDIEGLVYLHSILKTVTQFSLFDSTDGNLYISENIQDSQSIESIRKAIWNVFVPLATGAVKVEETLLETLPKDRVNIMSIHQAKGLQFPLLIIDIGSDIKDLHSSPFKRFPTTGGKTCDMEDLLRVNSPLAELTRRRPALDRAFDDLIRLYFVGYTRAMDALLLVGLNSIKDGYALKSGHKLIPHMATGWNRDENWIWDKGLNNLIHI